jgi:large subunit ribosomal protein L4
VLVLLPARNENVEPPARNIPEVKTLLAGYVNVRDLLGHQNLVLTPDTVAEIERILG